MAYVGKVLKHLRGARPRPKLSGSAGEVPGGEVLASPSFTAGWATFGLPLAPGDLPAGQALKVGLLDTQTDVVTTWPDGSAKLALVTCKPTGTATLDVATGAAAAGSFSPAVPTASVTFTVHTRFTLLGDFSVTSGTLKVTVRNVYGSSTVLCADAVLIEELDGSGNPTGQSHVVDNADGSPHYTESGTWGNGGSGYLSGSNCGYGDSLRVSSDNSATATWQKAGLSSGTYRVSACWLAQELSTSSGSSSTYKAGYEVFDNTTSRGELFFSQQWDSGECGGHTLGTFTISSGTCNVRASDDTATGYVFADKVAIYKDGALVAQKWYGDAGVTASGFLQTSNFAATNDQIYSTAVYRSPAASGSGSNTLTYQFTSLASGDYKVVVWGPWTDSDSASGSDGKDATHLVATDAPWTVLDNATSRGTTDVNQRVWGGRQKSTAYTATLAAGVNTSDRYLNGALVQEWRRTRTPETSGAVAHPALYVLWDVREYHDGAQRVRLTVENCRNKARVTACYYDVAVTVNGSSVFSQSAIEHRTATRWTRAFAAGGLSESDMTPDFSRAYSSSSKLLPKHQSAIADNSEVYNASHGRWKVLRRGGMAYDAIGSQNNDIGVYPHYAAAYLVKGFAANDKSWLFGTAFGGTGAYCLHFRNADDTFLDPAGAGGNFWPDQRNSATYTLLSLMNNGRQYYRNSLIWDTAHGTQPLYVPFLMTGDRYLADELAFVGAFGGMSGQNDGGVVRDANGPRGMAWGLRMAAEAAAILPDAHPAKSFLATMARNTVAFHDGYSRGEEANTLNGATYNTSSGTDVEWVDYTAGITGQGEDDQAVNTRICSHWQNWFLGYAIQRCVDLGLLDGVASNANGSDTMGIIKNCVLPMYENYNAGSPNDPALSAWPLQCNQTKLSNGHCHLACTDDGRYLQNWTLRTGTIATHFAIGTRAEAYAAAGCWKLLSDGSTLVSLDQEFARAKSTLANAGGTGAGVTLANSTTHYFVCWLKLDATAASGVVELALVDGSDAVHNSQAYTKNCADLTTSYTRFVAPLATGTLPGTYRVRIRFSTAPPSGRTLYVSCPVLWSTASMQDTQPFYFAVGTVISGNSVDWNTDSWDQLFAACMVRGTGGSIPFPQPGHYEEVALALNILERRGVSGAATAMTLVEGRAGYAANHTPANQLIRGMYA